MIDYEARRGLLWTMLIIGVVLGLPAIIMFVQWLTL